MRSAALILAIVGFWFAPVGAPAAASMTVVPYVGVSANGFDELPVALAGDSIISVDWREYELKPPTRIRVLRRTPDGVTTTLATLPAPPKSTSFYTVMLRSSETTWVAGVRTVFVPDDPEEQRRVLSDMVVAGAVSGGASRILASCRAPDALDQDQIWVAAAGDDVAWSNDGCKGHVNLATDATHGGPAAVVGDGAYVALTPTHLGFFDYDTQLQRQQLRVVDRATGAERVIDASAIGAFALGDGGLLAVIGLEDPACRDSCTSSIMRAASDGTITRPGIARLGRVGEPGVGDPEPFVAGGGRVLLERPAGNGLLAVDLATGARSYAGALGLEPWETPPIAVDATRAVYAGHRCDGHAALYFEDTVAPAPPKRSGVLCPVHVLSHTATLHLGTRSAHVRIRCSRGCDGSWAMNIPSDNIGVLYFHAPAGAVRRGTIYVARWVARKLRGRTRIAVTLEDDNDGEPRAEQPPVHLILKIRR
jgi:hypothetical protein